MVNWISGCNPEPLLRQMEETKVTNPDGSVGYQGMEASVSWTILYSMLTWAENIPEDEGSRFVNIGVSRAGQRGVLTPAALLTEVNRLERDYLRQAMRPHVLLTSLSIAWSAQVRTSSLDDATINFEQNIPLRYTREAATLIERATPRMFARPPANYLPVRVHVTARTAHAAAEKALNALDLLRGIWNWHYNRSRRMLWSNTQPAPVNRIVLGPIQTVHYPKGALADRETWWYDPRYVGPIRIHDIDGEFADLAVFYRYIQRRLNRCGYRSTMETAIRRYVRALDERHPDTAFVRLWSVLELLTDTARDRYEITIRRTASVYAESEYSYHYQILDRLREHRNQSVHFDASTSDITEYMYRLKSYVEAVLGFHLVNSFGFRTMQEAAEFMSLPVTQEAIEARIRLLNYARRFREPRT